MTLTGLHPLQGLIGSDFQADRPTQAMQDAILRTVAYADVFDYSLTSAELHRYLIGVSASLQEIRSLLHSGEQTRRYLSAAGGYYCLRGREGLLRLRRRRAEIADQLWPRALRYGRLIAALPFVRMLAVTGSLAMSNSEPGGDIDYLVVTAPGRLWLCRALVIVVVRWAARRGDLLCPNYFISSDALLSAQRDLYNAHEIAQMVPLSGMEVYSRMRLGNLWTFTYLPNAAGAPPVGVPGAASSPNLLTNVLESALSGHVGASLENWEMQRKIKRFTRDGSGMGETAFSADWCKGHFNGHAKRTLVAYADRLERLGLSPAWDGLP